MTAKKKKPGPRGGIKHQPGRGHDKKSGPPKKERYKKKAAKERRAKEEEARKLWQDRDSYSDELRKLLGLENAPKIPRPKSD